MKKNLLKYIIGFVCFHSFFVFSQKKDNTPVTNSQIRELFSQKENTCKVPIYLNSTYNNKVDNVVNSNIVSELNVKSNKGTYLNAGNIFEYNNYGNTQINYSFSENYYTPEKSEAIYRETLEKVLNKKIDSVFKNNSDLKDKITNWDYISKKFGNALEKLEDHDPNKKLGFDVLKKYTENISTAKCLNEDYGDQAIIETDSNGNKSYSFDLEKIKNDPNYFFIGDEVNGFRIIRKRNKYGYLNSMENLIEKVGFKYDYAENYHPSGFAVAGDNQFEYLIDNNSKERWFCNRLKNEKITILNKDRFLINGDNGASMVNQQGKVIFNSNFKIQPTDFTNEYFYVLDSISIKQLKKIKYGFPIILKKELINDIELLDYLESDENALTNLHFSDINGENISEKYENNKSINSFFNCSPRKNILDDKNENNFLVLKNIFNIPNSDYLFLYFLKTKDLSTHYIILGSNSKIISSTGINTLDKKNIHIDSFFPVFSLFQDEVIKENLELVIGYRILNDIYFEKDYESNDPLTTNFKKLETLREKREDEISSRYLLLNLAQQRFIGGENNTGFEYIHGTINQGKTIIVSKKNNNDELLDGAIDYNGLYIVPPIMRQLKYNKDGSFYDVKTNKDDSIYELNSLGNCTSGDCKKYNQIIREYFENENKN